MKTTITAYKMKEIFIALDRDYYTFDGLDALLEYYDSIDPNAEFDPIAICGECTEYGNGAVCSLEDLQYDYGYIYPVDEWLNDNALCVKEFDKDLYINALVERLEDYTTVIHLSNGNYILFAF